MHLLARIDLFSALLLKSVAFPEEEACAVCENPAQWNQEEEEGARSRRVACRNRVQDQEVRPHIDMRLECRLNGQIWEKLARPGPFEVVSV